MQGEDKDLQRLLESLIEPNNSPAAESEQRHDVFFEKSRDQEKQSELRLRLQRLSYRTGALDFSMQIS